MHDAFGRDVTYLRLSVTDLCNCRCVYCMPACGVPRLRHEDVLTFERMQEIVAAAASLGVRKVRLTGGEPLVRRGIVDLVRMVADVPGVEEVDMTTNATLLVDTYNTLHSGIPNAIRAFDEILKPMGITKCGIRLDSGDLAYLTQKARKMLDDAGWTECKISVSNSLDEYLIQDMLLQGAQIDMFGVGERLITAKSEPVFGGVYKLVAIEEPDGTVVPKIKVSENVEKITVPHFKKVYRFYGRDSGKAIADYMTLHDEVVDDTKDITIFDPLATWKKKRVHNFEARELLVPVFLQGKCVYKSPSLQEIREYCRQQVDTLWDEVKRFDYPHKYYVDLSDKLWDIQQHLLRSSQE